MKLIAALAAAWIVGSALFAWVLCRTAADADEDQTEAHRLRVGDIVYWHGEWRIVTAAPILERFVGIEEVMVTLGPGTLEAARFDPDEPVRVRLPRQLAYPHASS